MDIIFDLDNTLHDKSATLKFYATHIYQNELDGADFTKEIFIDAFIAENIIVQPKSEVFKKLALTFNFNHQQEHNLLSSFNNCFHEFCIPFDGAIDCLTQLKNRNVSIGCITNGRDFFQRNKIRALGLSPFFDFIITSGEVGMKKPNIDIFKMGIDKLNTQPNNVCFCGDNLFADILPAKSLGLTTIWKSSKLIKPNYVDYVFDEFSHFFQIWEIVINRQI